jgi:FAD/FMN-containing dehydrogenase
MSTDLSSLSKTFKGDIEQDDETREFYSHDTSLFEVIPSAVVFPKDVDDVKNLVNWVNENKQAQPELSITARSAGTCMSGGAINDGIIAVFERYFNFFTEVDGDSIVAEPGVYYRDFEKETLKTGMIMPSYPASREMAAIGGMVANNAGGEKSLVYGKIENYVNALQVVLSDGNAYEIKPLKKEELDKKMAQHDFEGHIYREIFKLVDENYDEIKAAKPNVSKNSTGYKLWDVWDRETGVFDLTQLFIGAQGTLGLITSTDMKLIKNPKHSGVLVGYARSLEHMGEIIEILKKHNPTTIEAFDEHTVAFAFRFFLKFRQGIGWWGLFKVALQLIPDALILMRGIPKMIFMASFDDDSYEVIDEKIENLRKEVDAKHWRITTEEAETEEKSERFWMMRRKSFKLLRDNVSGGKHTAPFIDDLVVPTEHIKDFWPEIKEIMDRYGLLYTIAGHLGDGNFHIIPLMRLQDQAERDKIEPCMREVIELIKKYNGVMSGEHNDGLIRSPFLGEIYSENIVNHFKKAKEIFDPNNIFNPHKKTDATWEYSRDHIREKF